MKAPVSAEEIVDAGYDGPMERTRWMYAPEGCPYISATIAGLGGQLRAEPEDFRVEEIPLPVAEAGGDHVWVQIEKREVTTQNVLSAWERHWKAEPGSLGHAGLKDRRAVATQWLSVPSVLTTPEGPWPEMNGVTVLKADYRSHKLKAGDLLGNRFVIHLRDAVRDTRRLEAILLEMQARGVPNYFGPQRFGRVGDNAQAGFSLLRKGRKPRSWLEKLQAQALQSFVFNEWVARRLSSGAFETVVLGDVAMRHDTGGKFIVQDLGIDEKRAESQAISATGPLFGRKYHEAADDARQIEDSLLGDMELSRDFFRPLPGARRPLRLLLEDLTWELTQDGIRLTFSLPPGCYATSVMREIMKSPEGECWAM